MNERRRIAELAALLATMPNAPTHKVTLAPRTPRNAPRHARDAGQTLDEMMWAMHHSMAMLKRRRKAENQNREARMLALSLPSAPTHKVTPPARRPRNAPRKAALKVRARKPATKIPWNALTNNQQVRLLRVMLPSAPTHRVFKR